MRSEVRVRSTPVSMSIARAAVPADNKVSGSFCGDAEVFLDRMLEQCHRRPKGRHPGFGRELVPYFAEGEAMEQHSQYSNIDRCGQVPNKPYGRSPSSGKTRSPRSPLSPRFSSGSFSRERRNGGQVQDVYGQERGRRRGGGFGRSHGHQALDSNLFSRRSNNKVVASTFGTKQHSSAMQTCRSVHHMINNTSSVGMHSLFAGPGCFQSPSPESLPMPTSVLLAKAICPFPI